MLFFLRSLHIAFWLFVFWVAFRVWELSFEVSPLPAWTLTAFVFLLLFGISFVLARRLQKHHPLDRKNALTAACLLVGLGLLWELGLTVYLAGFKGIPAMFTWRFLVGLPVQFIASLFAAHALKHAATRRQEIAEERAAEQAHAEQMWQQQPPPQQIPPTV